MSIVLNISLGRVYSQSRSYPRFEYSSLHGSLAIKVLWSTAINIYDSKQEMLLKSKYLKSYLRVFK